MARQIQIRIYNDGNIETKTKNIKGKQCLKYMNILETILAAKVVDSEFTEEYYEKSIDCETVDNVEVLSNGK